MKAEVEPSSRDLPLAAVYDKFRKKNAYYHEFLKTFLRENIPSGSRVLSVGSGTGELLNSVHPCYGQGWDINESMVQTARQRFPHLNFDTYSSEGHFPVRGQFDYVIMVNLLDHTHDIWSLLKGIEPATQEGTVLCISSVNPLWQPLFYLAEALKLKIPEVTHNFIRLDDIVNLLDIFDYEVVKKEMRLLIPLKVPFLSDAINRWVLKIPWVRNLSAVQTLVARKRRPSEECLYSCSVVIPCHNEEGNVDRCAKTTPQMGRGTEVIFVDDGSTDGTLQKMEAVQKKYPHVKVISYPKNRGKGHAVRQGFSRASGDILMILDADLTVPAENLHPFYYVLSHHKARFVNGSRLVYPLEDESMRTANLWGNQFFGMIMSWLLNQRVSDTLCGTKALFKKDYVKMNMGKDRWGDYDLLFGAAALNLKIAEVPTQYKRRVSGASKMKTFQHALLLARICIWGFLHFKLGRFFLRRPSLSASWQNVN